MTFGATDCRGTALGNVVAVYTEFGRGRDQRCYLAWHNSVPAT